MIRIMACSICNRPRKEHLLIFGKNICAACEAKLVRTSVDDVTYPEYMNGIKQILTTAAKE